MIYQCLICKQVYTDTDIKSDTRQRYLDCDIWRCPHCRAQQDSRDMQKFLGVGGGGSVRYVDESVDEDGMYIPNYHKGGWEFS